MKVKIFKVAAMAVFVFITGLNVYKSQTSVQLSDAQLKNVEALANGEGGDCIEWVDKKCYSDFSLNVGDDYYATCSGTPSVSGGKLECGAVSIYEPTVIWSSQTCLQCVRTN